MKITKRGFGYVLETGCAFIVFNKAKFEDSSIPDVDLFDWHSDEYTATIPNKHIKEFEQKFNEVGGVVE